jgi:group I intron endonuclease
MADVCGIYEIVHIDSGRKYVGSSSTVNRRIRQHKIGLRGGYHENQYLQRAWSKYGEEVFEFKILAVLQEEDKLPTEQRLLDRLRADKAPLFNIALNAVAPMKGRRASEATREKMRARVGEKNPFFGRQHTESTKAVLRASSMQLKGERNPFFGKTHSDETKKRISEAGKGSVCSAQTIEKRKATLTIKPIWNKGVPMSDEAKKKLAASKRGKPSKKKGTHSAICRNGHVKTAENSYIYKGKWNCRVCMKAAADKFNMKKLKGEGS